MTPSEREIHAGFKDSYVSLAGIPKSKFVGFDLTCKAGKGGAGRTALATPQTSYTEQG